MLQRPKSGCLLSHAIGLIFFVLLPMTPPRLLPEYGFVDTVLETPALANQYAAMPRVHVQVVSVDGHRDGTLQHSAVGECLRDADAAGVVPLDPSDGESLPAGWGARADGGTGWAGSRQRDGSPAHALAAAPV